MNVSNTWCTPSKYKPKSRNLMPNYHISKENTVQALPQQDYEFDKYKCITGVISALYRKGFEMKSENVKSNNKPIRMYKMTKKHTCKIIMQAKCRIKVAKVSLHNNVNVTTKRIIISVEYKENQQPT